MKSKIIFFILLGLGVLFYGLSDCFLVSGVYASSLPFQENETITYAVKLNGISIGRAVLNYKGRVKLEGKDVYLIVFSTDIINFKDTETMYADDNFFPVRIERNIIDKGKKVFIVEEYNQNNNSVKISQSGKKQNDIKEIKQDDRLQNVILSTYLRRKTGDFTIGREFPVTLPLAKIMMRITKETSVHVPFGSYSAYLFESFPKGHQIWFETSGKAIPVRISKPFFLGGVNMVMMDYK